MKFLDFKEMLVMFLKFGMSAVLSILGVILLFLGSVGHAVVPGSFWAGGVILLVSLVYLIFESVIRLVKINTLIKLEKNKVVQIQGVADKIGQLKKEKVIVRNGCSCQD